MEERTVPQNRNIRADQVVRLCASTKAGAYPTLYRRIVLWVEDKQGGNGVLHPISTGEPPQ